MDTLFVVVDEGSNQAKSIWYNHVDGKFESDIIPSLVRTGYDEDIDGNAQPFVYEIDGSPLRVVSDDNGRKLDTAGEEYQVSNTNLAIFTEILRRNHAGKTVDVSVTLPIKSFFNNDNRRNNSLIQQKQEFLQKEVINVAGKPLATINSVKVSPEGIPIWFDLLFTDELQFNKTFEHVEKVLLVDIGGTTVDVCVITAGGQMLDKTSIDVGCFEILENLKDRISGGVRPSNVAIENAVRSKTYRDKDISAEILASARPVVGEIVNKLRIIQKDPDALDYVVYAGGGANLIGKELDKQYGGNALFPAEPELALARGILKRKLIADKQAEAAKQATAEA